MRKYAFRQGDTVKERTAYGRPIIGRVIGCSSSQEHDYYKIASRGDVYNARDDELELVRRAPSKYARQGLVDQFLLNWYAPEQHPAEGETCLVIWTDYYGSQRVNKAKWNGNEWEMEIELEEKINLGPDMFDAWAPWEWPELAEPETGEEGEERDGSADLDG